MADEDGGAGAGTVAKALDVLDQIAAAGRPVRFAELQSGSRFPKATLYRLIQTLTREGMLSFDAERMTYAPGPRLMRLAHGAWAQFSLAPVARRFLDSLSAEVGEAVHLAQLDQGQVLYIDKRHAVHPVKMFAEAGRVGPAYCTGVGKAMLAHLPETEREEAIGKQSFHRFTAATITDAVALRLELEAVRRRGWAVDREEHEPGIICVAVPILAAGGSVLGGLSITSTVQRTTLGALEARLALLRETAWQIASEAQYRRFPEIA